MTAETASGRDVPRYNGPAVTHRITLSGLANGSVRAVCEPCAVAGEPWARTFEGGRELDYYLTRLAMHTEEETTS